VASEAIAPARPPHRSPAGERAEVLALTEQRRAHRPPPELDEGVERRSLVDGAE
jgi:hypothetical protein